MNRPSESDALPPTLAHGFDRVCNRFEQAWRIGPPRIDGFLDDSSREERAARVIVDWLDRSVPASRDELGVAMLELYGWLPAGPAGPTAARAVQALVVEMSQPTNIANQQYRAVLLEQLAEKLDNQGLIDTLQTPLCVGRARRIILTILHRRTNQPFATVWDVASWAREKEPSLDLRSPPRRDE